MQLAQINIARMRAPLDSALMKDFVDNLDRINTLAENSPGFVWRLKDETNNATSIRPFGDDYIVNMSVWKDMAALKAYAYQSDHVEIMKRRKEWFFEPEETNLALWYINDGMFPDEMEGKERLAFIRKNGETPYAFTFRSKFTPAHLDTFLNENHFIL